MRRHGVGLLLGLAALLLTPGAAGVPNVPGDPTPPTVTPLVSGTLGTEGWYTSNVTVNWSIVDPESVILSTSGCDARTLTADSAATRLTCAAESDGGETAVTKTIKLDKTAPTASATPSRPADANGWYNHELTVGFAGTDAMSGLESCSAARSYEGPDTPSTSVSGTCRDRAGNTAPAAFALKYDETSPQASPAARLPDANGWYNHAVVVTFLGADGTSGVQSCAQVTYDGPDDSSAALSGTCLDRAGNQSASSGFTLKYDETAPQASATTSRAPDVNGWYNDPLTVSFAGSDVTSGLESCDAPKSYSSPDSAAASVSGTCRDQAGNESVAKTVQFKYDATPPSNLGGSASRSPDANGWYNHALAVTFQGSDATSPPTACTQTNYGGPDNAAATVSGTCRDQAGNESVAKTVQFKYDGTPPSNLGGSASRSPDANGWYNHALAVTFQGSDATSPPTACTQTNYGGPDNANASILGTCTDTAGNQSVSKTFQLKYDDTAPQVTGVTPAPDATGWYTQPVVFGFQGSDGLSGLDSCPSVTYDGPDGAEASVIGACLDKAGNVGTRPFPLKYDDTGPAVTPTATRAPDFNGWYNHPLSVGFAGSDTASGLASCARPQTYEGPETVFAVVTGTCVDKAGNVGVGALTLKYDSTSPQVDGASADRAPDGNGWYNRPLRVSFRGSDGTSQIEACSAADYAGPDNPSASVAGYCRDRAGNESGLTAFGFRFDSTAPSIVDVKVKAGNRSATLTWQASRDTNLVEIVRTARPRSVGVTVYRGTERAFTDTHLVNGIRYRYTLTGYDEARNAATEDIVATPAGPLISPLAGATVSGPPRLVWKRVESAKYYNVQVWRRGKIFSAWPMRTSLRLPRSWTYDRRRYRLSPGQYRWYVWPGYGRRTQRKYGPLLGSSSFVVRASKR